MKIRNQRGWGWDWVGAAERPEGSVLGGALWEAKEAQHGRLGARVSQGAGASQTGAGIPALPLLLGHPRPHPYSPHPRPVIFQLGKEIITLLVAAVGA